MCLVGGAGSSATYLDEVAVQRLGFWNWDSQLPVAVFEIAFHQQCATCLVLALCLNYYCLGFELLDLLLGVDWLGLDVRRSRCHALFW